EEDVQLAALKALRVWGDDADAAAVVPFASHESLALRTEAIYLLGKLRTPVALSALVDRLEEDTELAKAALIRSGKGCEQAVRKGLKSKSVTVRLACLKIVDTLGLKGALIQVRAMAENDKDGEVKNEARSVADKLAKKDEKKKS